MSAEVETGMKDHTLIKFWGGADRGGCLQVTAIEGHGEGSFINLTMEEAAALCNNLTSFVKLEATRRQGLLKKKLEELRMAEKSVFDEVAALPMTYIGQELAVEMISKFCPKDYAPRN